MKHFSAQTGGRYTYTDDIENLQSLALAINSIFDGCDNFIISGCEVNGSSITPGYVYINGEIRYFSGASNQTWPSYLYEHNSNETVAYVSGSSKVGRVNYGVQIGKVVPTAKDPITNSVPQYIQILAKGGRRMKDAFFAKYALIINPVTGSQSINGNVEYTGKVTAKDALTIEKEFIHAVGANTVKGRIENGKYAIEASLDNKVYKIEVGVDGGYTFYVDNKAIVNISKSGVMLPEQKTFSASMVTGGNIALTGNSIFNIGSGDKGYLDISMTGYEGGTQYARITRIGDGQGSVLLEINPVEARLNASLPIQITGTSSAPIMLVNSIYDKTNVKYQSGIVWKDKDGIDMGKIGFINNDSQLFTILNIQGSVKVTGASYVDIGPEIRENGASLSQKYLTIKSFNQEMTSRPKNSDVYNRTISDERFAKLSNGLNQFINDTNTQGLLRAQIGAVSIDDVTTTCPRLDKYLSDMASTESAKTQIRINIGAAPAGAYQPKISDTGWVGVDGQSNVYARQIGNIVCIQGDLVMQHDGIAFKLPSNISAPAHSVSTKVDKYDYGAYITKGSVSATILAIQLMPMGIQLHFQ